MIVLHPSVHPPTHTEQLAKEKNDLKKYFTTFPKLRGKLLQCCKITNKWLF
jgi:hypothetical protein